MSALGIPETRLTSLPPMPPSSIPKPVAGGTRQLRPGARVLVVRERTTRSCGGLHLGAVSPQAQPSQGSRRRLMAASANTTGAQVDFCVAYGRGRARLDAATAHAYWRGRWPDGAIWLLSSSGVGHLKLVTAVFKLGWDQGTGHHPALQHRRWRWGLPGAGAPAANPM